MKISKYLATAALTAAFSLATSVKAEVLQDLAGITLTTVGSAGEGVGFFNTVEYPATNRPSGACVYGLYYVKLDTPGGRAMYATLLNTKNLGKKLVRIDWNRVAESGGVFCYVSLLITQD